MQYYHIRPGIFIRRPNRFIAYVEIDGKEEICHVKNTGRCRELLIPGAKVFVEESSNPNRKTKYDLVQVYKEERLVNMDSQMPNALVEEWVKQGGLFRNITRLQREKTYGNSRFDLYVEYQNKKAFVEVKGVTLEKDGVARFPDAPTQRGVKHLKELQECIRDGYEAWIIFVVQMKGVHLFEPNEKTHSEFAEALREAERAGVQIEVRDCIVEPARIKIDRKIPVDLTTEKR